MRRRRFLAIAAAAALPFPARAERLAWQAPAFGGTVSVELRGPRGAGREVLAAIGAEIAGAERLFSLFRPDSALSRLNATGGLDPAPEEMLAILAVADRVHGATGGVFDPTVQPLWQALAGGDDAAQARALIGWDRVRRGPGAIRLAPGQGLTLNGIAQGFAADRVRAILARAGYGEALIDMGEFAALGGPFRLGVEDPALGLVGTRTISGGALATSSPGALLLAPGQGHVLGPQGQPALWSTVTVETESAAIADAASTAFCLMDRAAIAAARDRLGLPMAVLLVDPAGDVTTL